MAHAGKLWPVALHRDYSINATWPNFSPRQWTWTIPFAATDLLGIGGQSFLLDEEAPDAANKKCIWGGCFGPTCPIQGTFVELSTKVDDVTQSREWRINITATAVPFNFATWFISGPWTDSAGVFPPLPAFGGTFGIYTLPLIFVPPEPVGW